jgi:hypothetical protein
VIVILDAIRRFLVGILLGLGLVLAALVLPFILAFNRASYADETGSGASCLLNAMTGGKRTVTFSAWSWKLALEGKKSATWRVPFVDGINFQNGHCQDAYDWHVSEGLIKYS